MIKVMMSTAAKHAVSLQKALALSQVGENVFINKETLYVPTGARGVFGGCIAAQSLYAAIKTVPDSFVPHSLHSYFILGGDVNKKIKYHVDVLRDGNSFSSRQVKAYQDDKLIFTQNISFTNTTPKRPLVNQLTHARPYPYHVNINDYKTAHEVIKNSIQLNKNPDFKNLGNIQNYEFWERYEKGSVEHLLPTDFFEIPDMNHPNFFKQPYEIDLNLFVKVHEKINDPKFNYVALTYYSDALFLITSMKFHNRAINSQIMSVSLDHVIYFHKEFNANDWKLFHIKHPKSGNGRNFMHGEFYDNDELIATVTQEGYVVIDGNTNKKNAALQESNL